MGKKERKLEVDIIFEVFNHQVSLLLRVTIWVFIRFYQLNNPKIKHIHEIVLFLSVGLKPPTYS